MSEKAFELEAGAPTHSRFSVVIPALLHGHWPFALLLCITLPFLLIRLYDAPPTWFDEGINMTAARTLAETGIYGLRTADGLRPADPAIQSGPPMIVLLAALHLVFGPSLLAARLLMVVFALLTLLVLYRLTYRLYGLPAAYLAVVFAVALPGGTTGSFVMQSRQFLGEIPAALFLLLALLMLLDEQPSLKQNILAGLCLGIAAALKSQVLVMVLLTLALRLFYAMGQERETLRRWFVILLVAFAVYGLDWLWRYGMAGEAFAHNTAVLREGIAIHILPFRTLANLSDRQVLIRLLIALTAVGGTLAFYRANPLVLPADYAKRRIERFLMALIAVWMVWYAIASIGWIRYAFISLVLSTVLLGRVGAWLWQRLWPQPGRAGYLIVAAGIAGLLVYTKAPLLSGVQGADFDSMMAYIQREIPTNETILTWEWSAVYVTDHSYLLPGTHVTNAITAASFDRGRHTYNPAIFDPLARCPRYVLYGSFAVDRIVFGKALERIRLVPLFSSGRYELYAIPHEQLQTPYAVSSRQRFETVPTC